MEDNDYLKILLDDILNQIDKNENIAHNKKLNDDEISISDSDSDSDLSINDISNIYEDRDIYRHIKPAKTKGEIILSKLPPVQELNIKCNINELEQIGIVLSIVFPLIVIESFKNLPALDLDSILFLRDGNAIGEVFDVFGPVIKPYYCVRFIDNDQLFNKGIKYGSPIYFVPGKIPEFTKYVLVKQLLQTKGSDASWFNNNEPPDHLLEYSDDEEEQKAKQKLLSKRKHEIV